MDRHEVLIEDTGERYLCPEDRNLLEAMEALGRKGVPVGCRSGGCGVCKVRITGGPFRTRVMSRAHVNEAEQQDGVTLACRAYPLGPLGLTVLGALRKAVCRPAAAVPAPPEPLVSLPAEAPAPAPLTKSAPSRKPGLPPARPAHWVSPEPNDMPLQPADPWSVKRSGMA